MGLVELCRLGGTAITRIARNARAGYGGDDLRLHIDVANDMTVALGDKHVSLAVESHLVRRAEQSGLGRTAIAGMSLRSGARDHVHAPGIQIDTQDAVAAEVGPIERAVRAEDNPVRIVDRRGVCGGAVRGGSGNTGADQRCHAPAGLRKEQWRREHSGTRLKELAARLFVHAPAGYHEARRALKNLKSDESCISNQKLEIVNRIGGTAAGCISISPSGEEGPTRRSSKCHATFESARRGRSYSLPDLQVYDLPRFALSKVALLFLTRAQRPLLAGGAG